MPPGSARRPGQRYRLPTEQEFEYAARAGRNGTWAWGEEPFAKTGCRAANIFDQSGKAKYPLVEDALPCDDGFAQTAPVDALAGNAFGLKGMIGNVWEWVADCYHPTYDGAPTDGSAWTDDACTERSIRGQRLSQQHLAEPLRRARPDRAEQPRGRCRISPGARPLKIPLPLSIALRPLLSRRDIAMGKHR